MEGRARYFSDTVEDFDLEEVQDRAEKRSTAVAFPRPDIASTRSTMPLLVEDPAVVAHRAAQRQKQIDYGKNTLGYQRYTKEVPREKRGKADPCTPDIHSNVSKRAFDGQVKVWRRCLHMYDPDGDDGGTAGDQFEARARRGLAAASRALGQKAGGSGTGRRPAAALGAPRPSSPHAASDASQGSLEAYGVPPPESCGTKRVFRQAFSKDASNPAPSKLITSPAAPKPRQYTEVLSTTVDTHHSTPSAGAAASSPARTTPRRLQASGAAAGSAAAVRPALVAAGRPGQDALFGSWADDEDYGPLEDIVDDGKSLDDDDDGDIGDVAL